MRKKYLLSGAIILNLAFIWGNSLLSGEISSDVSGGLLALLREEFPFLAGMGELLLRKLGHFSEFTCLGLLLCWRLWLQKGNFPGIPAMLCGVLAAMADETIQAFVPGRGSSVIDVWIDTAGVCTGIVLLLLGHTICKNHGSSKRSGG